MTGRPLAIPLLLAFAACAGNTPPPPTTGTSVASSSLLPPLAGTVKGNPAGLQSRFGGRGNYELVALGADGGLLYYWRNNDLPDVPWHGPTQVFLDQGPFDAVAMVQNGAVPDEMDVLAMQGDSLFFLWRDGDVQLPWHATWAGGCSADLACVPGPLVSLATGVRGVPSLLGDRTGALTAIVPLAAGGLAELVRPAGASPTSWTASATFGADLYDAVSVVQADAGLIAVARHADRIDVYQRASGADWQGPEAIGRNESGNPVLVAGASAGAFTVLVPGAVAGVDAYARGDDGAWSGPQRVLDELGHVDAVSAFPTTYFAGGGTELVARVQSSLYLSTKAGPDARWSAPVLAVGGIDARAPEPAPELTNGYWEYLGPFTGAAVSDEGAYDLHGTDLGQSYETPDGHLAFLFGDSSTVDGEDGGLDSIAFTDATFVDRLHTPKLTWARRPGSSKFLPFDPPGINGGGGNVPLEGIALGGREYVFYDTDWSPIGKTRFSQFGHVALATTSTAGGAPSVPSLVYVAHSQRFINVNAVPGDDGYVYVYGTGFYRQSPVYLARVAVGDLTDRSKWTYYRGMRGGAPVFGPDELTSVPLFRCAAPEGPAGLSLAVRPDIGIGEFSVRRDPTSASPLYLMTYKAHRGCGQPYSAVHVRSARAPWGPWSQQTGLFTKAEAYGRFVHYDSEDGMTPPPVDDGLARDPGVDHQPNGSGGLYGPYLVPRWFTREGSELAIVYTISSWNPYQAHLVRSVLTTDGRTATAPVLGRGVQTALVNGDFAAGDTRGWQSSGAPFRVVRAGDGTVRATTTGAGQLSQSFVVNDVVSQLRFTIRGGSRASARLTWRGALVRETRGRDAPWTRGSGPDLQVAWSLVDFRGEELTLTIQSPPPPDNGIAVSAFAFR